MINLNPNKLIPETPIINNINNGILSSRRAMPLKGISSDNAHSFAKGRMVFSRTHESKPTTEKDILQYSKNKLIGVSNRDASQVAKNRRVNNIANGTLNASQKKWHLQMEMNQTVFELHFIELEVVVPEFPPKYLINTMARPLFMIKLGNN